jgi:glyoxylase-like metal-dependent hydrolase (beta-lactamase superfamily II)
MNGPTNTVHVVVEGYARPLAGGGWQANSSCALVTTPGGLRILADPGGNRTLLLAGLRRLRVGRGAIAYVFLTHHHLDHAMNVALFRNAKVIDHEAVYDGDCATPVGGVIPGTDVAILPTPGHTPGHASLVVPSGRGTVVVAGDVFWWRAGEPQTLDPEQPDDLAADPARLRRSREAVLERADWIIPGHGRTQRVGTPR